jgi:hypothetical protein
MSIALELRRPSSLAVLVAALAACSGGGGGGGGGAALTVTPTSLAFSTVEKAVNPPSSKSFQVTVNDSTTRYVAAGYPAGTTVPSWLGLSVYGSGCGFRPSRSAIPADADHPFRQGDHPGRDAAG